MHIPMGAIKGEQMWEIHSKLIVRISEKKNKREDRFYMKKRVGIW